MTTRKVRLPNGPFVGPSLPFWTRQHTRAHEYSDWRESTHIRYRIRCRRRLLAKWFIDGSLTQPGTGASHVKKDHCVAVHVARERAIPLLADDILFRTLGHPLTAGSLSASERSPDPTHRRPALRTGCRPRQSTARGDHSASAHSRRNSG